MLLELIGIIAAYNIADDYNNNKAKELELQKRQNKDDEVIKNLEREVKIARLEQELRYLKTH